MTTDTALPDDLEERIEATRITYPAVGPPDDPVGVRVKGAAFLCEFDEPVDPEAVRDEIGPAPPWNTFHVDLQVGEDYWRLNAVLVHVEDGKHTGASKLDLELAPTFLRVYVKEDCSAARAAEFVRTLDDEYGVTVEFVEGIE